MIDINQARILLLIVTCVAAALVDNNNNNRNLVLFTHVAQHRAKVIGAPQTGTCGRDV